MKRSRTKIYSFVFFACVLAYAWLYYHHAKSISQSEGVTVCLIKEVTGLPCPSCGSTRAMLSILQGEFLQSIYLNPIGFILIGGMLILPFWIVIDLAFRKKTLMNFYHFFEMSIQKKAVAVPVSLLVLVNWIWNIYKGV